MNLACYQIVASRCQRATIEDSDVAELHGRYIYWYKKYIYSIGNIAAFIPVAEVISILKLLSLESKIEKHPSVFF